MSENSKKPTLDIDELPLKHKAMAILTNEGLTTAEASKALEYKGKSGYMAKTKLNKHNLSNRKLGSLAFKAVKETLKMVPVMTDKRILCYACKDDEEKRSKCLICKGDGTVPITIMPSIGNRLEASKMYYDRADPVVQHIQTESAIIIGVMALDSLT